MSYLKYHRPYYWTRQSLPSDGTQTRGHQVTSSLQSLLPNITIVRLSNFCRYYTILTLLLYMHKEVTLLVYMHRVLGLEVFEYRTNSRTGGAILPNFCNNTMEHLILKQTFWDRQQKLATCGINSAQSNSIEVFARKAQWAYEFIIWSQISTSGPIRLTGFAWRAQWQIAKGA